MFCHDDFVSLLDTIDVLTELALQVTNSNFNLTGLSEFLHLLIVVTFALDIDHNFPTQRCVGLILLAEAPFNALWGVANLNVDFGETIANQVGKIEALIGTNLCAQVEQNLHEWPNYFARVT